MWDLKRKLFFYIFDTLLDLPGFVKIDIVIFSPRGLLIVGGMLGTNIYGPPLKKCVLL